MILKRTYLLFVLQLIVCSTFAQRLNVGKMSPLIRELALNYQVKTLKKQVNDNILRYENNKQVCAFIRISSEADKILRENNCKVLSSFGDIYIAEIPVKQLQSLSNNDKVVRIEAKKSNSLNMDLSQNVVNATPVYNAEHLPQAYTGKGVVVGVQDIGFDLTHPNFYNNDLTEYRIKRFWDQLSIDTINKMYVGAEYVTEQDIKNYAHSRDGYLSSHGTHTLGCAAGSGFNTPYRGIAYESDICLVSNAVSEDVVLIDSANIYKYTYATDALGFEYILNYAKSQNKPCVISFSEGSPQDVRGDDVLFYEVLDSLTSQGCIFVASAGNESIQTTYLQKPFEKQKASVGVLSATNRQLLTLLTTANCNVSLFVHNDKETPEVISFNTDNVLSHPDSTLTITQMLSNGEHIIKIVAYKHPYNADKQAFEIYITSPTLWGNGVLAAIELAGENCFAQLFPTSGYLYNVDKYIDGETKYCIHSPSSAPAAICVGATSYRQTYIDYKGIEHKTDVKSPGDLAPYSSIGPTIDDRIKPDVVAPGSNIISSYSSFFIEKDPESRLNTAVNVFPFNGRTYSWQADTGTSMATPTVAGAIALWLQAKPTLTTSEIKEVFAKTCKRKYPEMNYPNTYYGYGEIDVYKGLLYILALDKVENLSTHAPCGVKIQIKQENTLVIECQETPKKPYSIGFYSTNGTLVCKKLLQERSKHSEINLDFLQQGVYAIQINCGKTPIGSSLIRVK